MSNHPGRCRICGSIDCERVAAHLKLATQPPGGGLREVHADYQAAVVAGEACRKRAVEWYAVHGSLQEHHVALRREAGQLARLVGELSGAIDDLNPVEFSYLRDLGTTAFVQAATVDLVLAREEVNHGR